MVLQPVVKSYNLVQIALHTLQREPNAILVPEEYNVMVLAGLDPLIYEDVQLFPEEVQLLADCFAPVFITKIPTAAEDLILRGLLRVLTVRRPCTCFLLAITEDGRSQVEAWIEQNGRAA